MSTKASADSPSSGLMPLAEEDIVEMPFAPGEVVAGKYEILEAGITYAMDLEHTRTLLAQHFHQRALIDGRLRIALRHLDDAETRFGGLDEQLDAVEDGRPLSGHDAPARAAPETPFAKPSRARTAIADARMAAQVVDAPGNTPGGQILRRGA